MIIKTTNGEDTLPIGLYSYTDDNNKTQYLNNLKGDQKVSNYNGKKLTRLAELLLKNDNKYTSLDSGVVWTPSSYKDVEEVEILSTTTYSYDTGYVLREDNCNYGCKVYKAKANDTSSTIIKSSESKQLYVYKRIYFNSADEVTFSKENLSKVLVDDNTIIDITDDTNNNFTITNNNNNFTITNNNNNNTITIKKSESSSEQLTVTVLYDVFAIIDFTDRDTIEYLFDNPYDKNAATLESTGYMWELSEKLTETSITKSIIKLVNKTN